MLQNKIIIGITGGIGSGKTLVSKVLEVMGFPVFNADKEAKKIYNDETFLKTLKERWGEEVFESNDKVSYAKISELVFNDPEELNWLNSKIHPFVGLQFMNWAKQQKSEIIFKEAAILFESNGHKSCDYVIAVEAPEEIRINRVIQRDQSTKQQVINRLKQQNTDEYRAEKSDFLIENHLSLIVPQINKIITSIPKQ